MYAIRSYYDHVLEGIEIDGDQVDACNAVLFHRLGVARLVADRQQAAVDAGMQRLDTAVHDFGKAGDGVDVGDGQVV